MLDKMKSSRRQLVAELSSLTYLDDRPVFELERVSAEAWWVSYIIYRAKLYTKNCQKTTSWTCEILKRCLCVHVAMNRSSQLQCWNVNVTIVHCSCNNASWSPSICFWTLLPQITLNQACQKQQNRVHNLSNHRHADTELFERGKTSHGSLPTHSQAFTACWIDSNSNVWIDIHWLRMC